MKKRKTCHWKYCKFPTIPDNTYCSKHWMKIRRRSALKVAQSQDNSAQLPGQTGSSMVSVGHKRNRKLLLVAYTNRAGIIGDPAMELSYRLFRSLRKPPKADCIVYDAAGKVIAKINGETRERTAVP